jgi:hypothetical protein
MYKLHHEDKRSVSHGSGPRSCHHMYTLYPTTSNGVSATAPPLLSYCTYRLDHGYRGCKLWLNLVLHHTYQLLTRPASAIVSICACITVHVHPTRQRLIGYLPTTLVRSCYTTLTIFIKETDGGSAHVRALTDYTYQLRETERRSSLNCTGALPHTYQLYYGHKGNIGYNLRWCSWGAYLLHRRERPVRHQPWLLTTLASWRTYRLYHQDQ